MHPRVHASLRCCQKVVEQFFILVVVAQLPQSFRDTELLERKADRRLGIVAEVFSVTRGGSFIRFASRMWAAVARRKVLESRPVVAIARSSRWTRCVAGVVEWMKRIARRASRDRDTLFDDREARLDGVFEPRNKAVVLVVQTLGDVQPDVLRVHL